MGRIRKETLWFFLATMFLLALCGLLGFVLFIAETKGLRGEALQVYLDDNLQPETFTALCAVLILGSLAGITGLLARK